MLEIKCMNEKIIIRWNCHPVGLNYLGDCQGNNYGWRRPYSFHNSCWINRLRYGLINKFLFVFLRKSWLKCTYPTKESESVCWIPRQRKWYKNVTRFNNVVSRSQRWNTTHKQPPYAWPHLVPLTSFVKQECTLRVWSYLDRFSHLNRQTLGAE